MIFNRSKFVWPVVILFCIVLTSCSTTNQYSKDNSSRQKLTTRPIRTASQNNSKNKNNHKNGITCYLIPKCFTSKGEKDSSGDNDDETYSDQQKLEDALELCEESQRLWEKGSIDQAIEALDQSYNLILNVQTDSKKPELLQEVDDLRYLIAKRIVEIYTSRTRRKLGTSVAIPLVMNSYVSREIKLFQTGERKFFIEAYKRSGKYRPYIISEIKKAGLPEELSWLPLIESGFRVRALSRARALGLWQFIASTGYRFGLKRDQWIDERMDMSASTKAATQYLKALHELFGDWTTALAAYNCGEFNVLHAIRSQHINYLDNFWDLYPRLPLETARYVPRFLAVLHIINNPKKFGFDLPLPDPPLRFETVKINKQVSLQDLAKKVGISYSLLKDLNPELRYGVTPNYPYEIKIPTGTSNLILAHIDEVPRWKPKYAYRYRGYVRHRVRKGETLAKLARRYGTSIRRIKALNKIRNPRRLRVGQVLKIPVGKKRYRVARRNKTRYRGKKVSYRIKRGDTLWKLAKTFNVSVKEIKRINGLKSNKLTPGQVIKIYKN
ncbi:MAG TPA: LysM peptidoglycan-binding domain-containing protein [Deltaproteobacteria bacterium]|nr:LysM peptidoglycan-binding domain-containing protein [Deltaproteobacteria bacterium]